MDDDAITRTIPDAIRGDDADAFPPGLSQPALRALGGAGYTRLSQLTGATAKDLLALHGMGPKGIRILREALAAAGLSFAGGGRTHIARSSARPVVANDAARSPGVAGTPAIGLPMPIYVEIFIRGPMEEVWRLTQTPDLHARWDLRFTSIDYLPRTSESAPQRFRYATRILPGVTIEGWGETVGAHEADGTRSSALRFGSEDRRSLIRAGSGYWKYAPVPGGLRFITGYDYDVRWGAFGRVIDRIMLRPLIGWATAWSFDRLRRWIEDGVEPRQAARQALVHGLAATAVAFVWMWHGVVPKLAGPHPDELTLLLEAGVGPAFVRPAVRAIGALELAFGLAFLPFARRSWPWWGTIGAMIVATASVLYAAPERAWAAFNPVTLNVLLAVVAVIGLLSRRDLPSARRCLRRAPTGREERAAT